MIFKALVFRPCKGEILDGMVEGVDKVGIEIIVGSLKMFIPHTKIPHMSYNSNIEMFESNEDKT